MGHKVSRNKINNVDKFNELKVCTFNIRLFQSTTHDEKIIILMNNFIKSDNDIICLQGIHDSKLFRRIISDIYSYNKNIKTHLLCELKSVRVCIL